MTDGLSPQELLEAAGRAGVRVTIDQLKSWRRAGLIPRPTQTHQPGRPGSVSRYPSGTLPQLVAIARLHSHERRFDELRFDAWWNGYWVQPQKLRASLGKLLDDPTARIREIRGSVDDRR